GGRDEPEDLAFVDMEAVSATRLGVAVLLPEILHLDGRPGGRRPSLAVGPAIAYGDHFAGGHFEDLWAGQESPSTRTSPSAGIPGLANPMASLSCSLTPTTCFTRSS